MAKESKYRLKKILVVSIWIILLSGTVVLLIAAMSKKRNEVINRVEIKISGIQNNYFLGKRDVQDILQSVNGKKLTGESIHSLDLSAMESRLEKNQWIKTAEIFFDNSNVLQVKIVEREPIARIFFNSGSSFYIDSSLTRLPLSEKFSARLPVFSSFPDVNKSFSKQDSTLLTGIKILSEYLNTHPFWMAQIDQLNITTDNTFELIPKLGNQLIRFGDTQNYEEKFNKLLAFYQQVETKVGWNKYSVLDVRFRNQVVGVIRDAAEIKSDSLKSVQIMKGIIAESKKNSNDSTKIQLPQPQNEDNININEERSAVSEDAPSEKSEDAHATATPVISNPVKVNKEKPPGKQNKEVLKKTNLSKKKPPKPVEKNKNENVKKGKETPKVEIKKVPKAVMPTRTDY
ncbi:MAG: FtsQ-type POTRA domain-containing protein [Ginsengibacter sp.]